MSALRGQKAEQEQAVAVYSFTLLLAGDVDDDQAERLYKRCADVILGLRAGIAFASFDREAETMGEAVGSAIRDVEEITGQRVSRVEPEEFVSAADIARRTGRTRESVRLLIVGERGPGGFPRPVAWVGRRSLWGWADVASWFVTHDLHPLSDSRSAAFLGAMNGALAVRRLVPYLADEAERRALAGIVAKDAALLGVLSTDP